MEKDLDAYNPELAAARQTLLCMDLIFSVTGLKISSRHLNIAFASVLIIISAGYVYSQV